MAQAAEAVGNGEVAKPMTEPASVREEILAYSKDANLNNLGPQFAAYILQGIAMARAGETRYPLRAELALQKIPQGKARFEHLNNRIAHASRWWITAILSGGETRKQIVDSFNGQYSLDAARFWQWVAVTDNLREQAYILLCSDDIEQRKEGAQLMELTRIIVEEMKRQLTAWERAIIGSRIGNRDTIARIIGPLGSLFQQHHELESLAKVRIVIDEIETQQIAAAEADAVIAQRTATRTKS